MPRSSKVVTHGKLPVPVCPGGANHKDVFREAVRRGGKDVIVFCGRCMRQYDDVGNRYKLRV